MLGLVCVGGDVVRGSDSSPEAVESPAPTGLVFHDGTFPDSQISDWAVSVRFSGCVLPPQYGFLHLYLLVVVLGDDLCSVLQCYY